jgi:hypothetical protein
MTEHPYDGAEGRPLLDLVIKGMSVVDCEGTHVGTVDKVEGGHLKILRPDQRSSESTPICHAELDRRC